MFIAAIKTLNILYRTLIIIRLKWWYHYTLSQSMPSVFFFMTTALLWIFYYNYKYYYLLLLLLCKMYFIFEIHIINHIHGYRTIFFFIEFYSPKDDIGIHFGVVLFPMLLDMNEVTTSVICRNAHSQ